MCLLALLFPCITGKAWNNFTSASAETRLQVPAPAEINEIDPPAPGAVPRSLRRPQVHTTTRLYSPELMMKHNVDLIPEGLVLMG